MQALSTKISTCSQVYPTHTGASGFTKKLLDTFLNACRTRQLSGRFTRCNLKTKKLPVGS